MTYLSWASKLQIQRGQILKAGTVGGQRPSQQEFVGANRNASGLTSYCDHWLQIELTWGSRPWTEHLYAVPACTQRSVCLQEDLVRATCEQISAQSHCCTTESPGRQWGPNGTADSLTRNVKCAEASHIKIARMPCQHTLAADARAANSCLIYWTGVLRRSEEEESDQRRRSYNRRRDQHEGGGDEGVKLPMSLLYCIPPFCSSHCCQEACLAVCFHAEGRGGSRVQSRDETAHSLDLLWIQEQALVVQSCFLQTVFINSRDSCSVCVCVCVRRATVQHMLLILHRSIYLILNITAATNN